jgi:hypothetical protein
MTCPLYKSLKDRGTTVYVFPGVAEDISSSYQNSNYKMYFSKYVLLNMPKQNVNPGSATHSKPVYFDFDVFMKSQYATEPLSYKDQIVESLRNYVANQEVVIKESRLNNTEYYYDNTALETPAEKIFYKWCKKMNIIDFEPAVPEDEYFSNLQEFQSGNINDPDYFPEYLWKEREVVEWNTPTFNSSNNSQLQIKFDVRTNLKVNDIVNISNVSNDAIDIEGINTPEGINVKLLTIETDPVMDEVVSYGSQLMTFDILYSGGEQFDTSGNAKIVYNKLVQYIGEVNGVSNVQEANRSYTEVYAHIPDHTGQTPDILFRTLTDINYKPNLSFPIIPSQYQPEIVGAESFSSPIVSNPQNYPGSYLGQFDTLDFTYETATGDSVRRSGDYYGVDGDTNNPIVDGSTIDGISVDFNTAHYVKMNILGRTMTNFDQFDALSVNNKPPKDFEFNAILWYYTVEDAAGNSRTNLYGVSFLDNPDNNVIDSENGLRFPTYKKFVTNGNQDGTSYAFSLNLNFNIINDNPQDSYNPEAINSMFSMNLFNDSMSKLSSTNDSFINLIAEQGTIRDEITGIKGLLYTQTDLNTINTKINNLESLLRLYATNQMVSTDTIEVTNVSGTPPTIRLNAINTAYERVYVYKSTDLYNEQGVIPINLSVPNQRDFLVNFTNNDESVNAFVDNLVIVLDKDLYYRQSVDFYIQGSDYSSQNKKLDIYMKSDANSLDGLSTEVLVLGNIDLPVYYNSIMNTSNSAYIWKDFKFEIDFTKNITLESGFKLKLSFSGDQNIINNSIKVGDVLGLNNFSIGSAISSQDYSGQYGITSILPDSVIFDITSNAGLVNYIKSATSSLPLVIHSATSTLLTNLPYFSLNKGKNIKLTRVSDSNDLKLRYSISTSDI